MSEFIRYPRANGDGFAVVEVLSEERALASTEWLLKVIQDGYETQLEQGDNPKLPPGTVADSYAPTAMNMKRYAQNTRRHYELGSRIVVVHAASGVGFDAFAKLTPAIAVVGSQFGEVYLNDIIAARHHQGTGSMALHAALTRTGYAPDTSLVLEAFAGSSVNAWYERLLLEQPIDCPAAEDFYFQNKQTLPMTYYCSPEGVGIGAMVTVLEAAHPNLAEAQPL